MKDAQQTIALALSLCARGQNRGARFDAEIVDAQAKSRSGSMREALKILENAHSQAAQSGYLFYTLESGLAAGEIEISSGQTTGGRSRLQAIQKEASGKSFLLIARKAQAASQKDIGTR